MRKIICLILPLLILISCAPNKNNDDNTYILYYFSSSDKLELCGVNEQLEGDISEDTIYQIFSKLQLPDDNALLPVITTDIKLLAVSLSDSICTLTLSKRYNSISDTLRTAINSTLVKTLCSIETIEQVNIICEDNLLSAADSDFIVEPPRTHYETHTVNLYYANENFDNLQAESVHISLAPDTTLENAVLRRLLIPPEYEKLRPAIPVGTRLNGTYVSEGICYIDLSGEFITNAVHDEVHETLAIYSIVNTLTELPMISSVKFLIDGEDPSGYVYHTFTRPITNKTISFKQD